ncbi:MAG: hypothetical protein IPN90_06925 [Elusimicrobia bacterium]|nr:hypothetical protein [Elusimicrobiota bacterium]
MISLLGQNPGINLVGVEGAWGTFSLDPYRDFPDPAMTKDIAEFLLKKGMIAGPEYAGLTMPKAPTFFGIENIHLYNANVKALKTAFKDKEVAIAWVDALKSHTEKLKETDYSETLKFFDRNFSGYQSEKVKLADYVRYLTTTLSKIKSRPTTPQMQLLIEALNQEEVLDFRKVEAEREQMVEKLVDKLSQAQIQKLVNKSIAYRAGRVGYAEYHTHLKQICQDHGISMKDYPQMGRYIAYVLIADKIDRHGLLNELDTVERILPESLAKTPKEKELVALTYDLSLLHKLVRHEMSPTDWTHYQARGESIHTIPQRLEALGGKQSSDFALTAFEDFCRYAAERNTALTGSLAQQMTATKTNSSILIAGGFHTEGLSALLRQKQISYVVVTPKITTVPKDNNYLDVLARDPVPLEQLLASDRIYLAKPLAMADAHSSAALLINAIEDLLRHQKTIVPIDDKSSLTTDPDRKGNLLFTVQGRPIFFISTHPTNHPFLAWLSSLASIVKGALPEKTELEGSFFIVRDIENGRLEKEVKEVVGPKGSDERYQLSVEDREIAAALTVEYTDEIRESVAQIFNQNNLIPPFDVSGRIITTHKIQGKSFYAILNGNRDLLDAEWIDKTREQCLRAINAANKVLGLSYEGTGILENGWRIQVDTNLENFLFDDAGRLIAWIDPIATWPPESKKIKQSAVPQGQKKPLDLRALSGALTDAYQNGRLGTLSSLLPETENLQEIEIGLAKIAQDIIKNKMNGMDFHLVTDAKGKFMNVYESSLLPGYIIKTPKTEDPSGNPINFDQDILPGYRVAKEHLGGLFVIMALENILITIDGRPVTLTNVILQERAKPLSLIIKELKLKEEQDAGNKSPSTDIMRRFEIFKNEMWRRGVMDQDSYNEVNNYGLTASGEFVGFDVDGMIRIEDFLGTKHFPNTNRGQELKTRILGEWEKGKRGNVSGSRVHDIFEAEVRKTQEDWLVARFSKEQNSFGDAKPVNNIFYYFLRFFLEQEAAKKWAMRLLPLEISGLGVAGWFAAGWAPTLLGGMMAVDPTMMGGVLMAAGILVFRGIHFALEKRWAIRHPGLSPPAKGFWSNTGRMMPYAILPILTASPFFFVIAFSVIAFDHYAFDSKQLLNQDKPLSATAKTLVTSMVSATFAIIVAPIVLANFNFPMSAFFLISLVAQAFDPTTLQSFSEGPTAGMGALLIGTVSNFSTYALSMGWAPMAILGFATSTVLSKNVVSSVKKFVTVFSLAAGLASFAPGKSVSANSFFI